MAEIGLPHRRATIIYNPLAGSPRECKRGVERARQALSREGMTVEARATSRPGEAAPLARHAIMQGSTLIIVRGGDGTVNEALQGIVGSDVPLAIWPAGTVNVLAKTLRIPRDFDAIIKMIVRQNVRRISIGKADSRYFFLMAGIGLDASIVRQINPTIKRYGGILAFWVSGIKHLFVWDAPVFTVEVNGESFTATFAAIANAPFYGGGLVMAPDARMDDEFFRVCLIRSRNKLRLLSYLPLAFWGRHIHQRGVVYLKSQHVRAYSDQTSGVQVDGEFAGTLPMSFEILPRAVSVVVP